MAGISIFVTISFALRAFCKRGVEISNCYLPVSFLVLQQERCVQRCQCNGSIRRAYGKALLSFHDGMIPVVASHGKAWSISLAQALNGPSDMTRVSVIPAPNILAKISAYCCGVPNLWRCNRAGRFCKARVAFFDRRRVHNIRKLR